jgi:hypothetical protein
MHEHSLEAVKALDGKIFAMLTDDEMEVLNFYRAQGRKYGISATVEPTNEVADEVAAVSRQRADDLLKRTNSRVSVKTTTA